MDPVIVPALTALAGVAVRGIALAGLLARLRWQERHLRADRASLTGLAPALPPGFRLDELRADGSELHLATEPEPAERRPSA
jgi:hypothetical protein